MWNLSIARQLTPPWRAGTHFLFLPRCAAWNRVTPPWSAKTLSTNEIRWTWYFFGLGCKYKDSSKKCADMYICTSTSTQMHTYTHTQRQSNITWNKRTPHDTHTHIYICVCVSCGCARIIVYTVYAHIPSGKHTKHYARIHQFSWENSLFLWSCSIANCKRLPEGNCCMSWDTRTIAAGKDDMAWTAALNGFSRAQKSGWISR